MTATLTVGLGDRTYDVMIGEGLIPRAGELLTDLLPHRRATIVSDRSVADLHAAALVDALAGEGVSSEMIVVPPGEQIKTFEGLMQVSDELLALSLDRRDVVIALGGGVIGDLAGFAAAIYKRGIDFVQIPTTLLAQVDSSVGGKTAIDTPRGKNLIGAFHQPRRVLADLSVLRTLPIREVRCGYAEIIKYGLLGDADFFRWLEAHGSEVVGLDPDAVARAVFRSVEMKAEIVAEDEKETGRRALLNLGHTFGHALESECGFNNQLLHGEAVGAGMALAFRFSADLGLCSREDAVRAEAAIAASGLPTGFRQLWNDPPSADRLIDHMAQDKKAEGGKLTFVLVKALGQAFVAKNVEASKLRRFLVQEGAA